MRVDGNSAIRSLAGRRGEKAGGSGGGSFAEALGGEPTAATSKAAPTTALGSLFALQEVPDATAQRRKALARAGHLLDRLKELQHGLLEGSIDRAGLADLAASVRAAQTAVDDPQLADLLGEIELRAAVELAKLSSAP
jgi:Class II flagellar assembly regulator